MKKLSLSKLTFLRWYIPCATLLFTFSPSATHAEEPMRWPDQGPYQRIGPWELPMPTTVVKFTQDRLHEQPAKWEVENIFLGEPQQELAVCVGTAKAEVRFLVTSQSWCLLNERSLPCINEVLGHNLDRRSLYNEKKLHDYLRTLDYMVLGQGLNMDKEFVRRELTPKYARRYWLNGRVKSIKALRRLCHRPMVSVRGERVAITTG